MEYEVVIGLETHVQLKTKSKMWCGCANAFGADPNTLVCPICLGFPGVLPVANEAALRLTALAGLLLHCAIPARAKFDRKNYFYPDVAKNYQITQYDQPSTVDGYIDFEFEERIQRIAITRAHLEEDVGKNTHFENTSGVDFNRGGVPLLEIVSEPQITSPDMAYAYLNALKDILVHGGISDCDMEKGMVRCDLNVSIRPQGETSLGAKVEIKNMNTFSGARKALDYEIRRQIKATKQNQPLVQETRRWDDITGRTDSMRTKEHAHDYRYFPEPDLMPLEPSDEWQQAVRRQMVELPLDRKRRLIEDYGIPSSDAENFVQDSALGNYFEAAARDTDRPKSVANWIINNLRGKLAESGTRLAENKIAPQAIAELVALVDNGSISSKIAQDVFSEMFATGESPRKIVTAKGLAQVSDVGALDRLCDQAIVAHPKTAADYRAGKHAALNFLKGQVMQQSQGKANPALVGEILEKKLQP